MENYYEVAPGLQLHELQKFKSFNDGSILKYVVRAGKKPNEPLEKDLKKALDYALEAQRVEALRKNVVVQPVPEKAEAGKQQNKKNTYRETPMEDLEFETYMIVVKNFIDPWRYDLIQKVHEKNYTFVINQLKFKLEDLKVNPIIQPRPKRSWTTQLKRALNIDLS